jgi:assimilatory nitrate reductase catalytic subunit
VGLAGQTLFPYDSVESVWNEHRESTRGRDLDITGLSYARLEAPQQWPCPSGASSGTARLYTDGHFATPDGRARFVAPAYIPTAEVRDARYPFALTTGRLRDQWHGMSRTGTLGRLFAHGGEPAIELHPQELQRRQWNAGDLVRVQSRRGSLVLPVQPSPSVPPTQAFIAMHWGDEVLGGDGSLGINALTTGAFCPQSKQPELKHAAVRLERAELPWGLIAAAWLPAADWFATRERLRPLMSQFTYAACVPFGREPGDRVGLLWRSARVDAPDGELLGALEAAFQLADGPVLRYADARAGQHRAMRLHTDGTLQAFLLSGNAAAQGWVLDLLQQGAPAAGFGRALLAASAAPPQDLAPRRKQVCACHDVSEDTIVATLPQCTGGDEAAVLGALQSRLKCGTECGSCLPALKALVRQQQPRRPVQPVAVA